MTTGNRSRQHALLAILVLAGLVFCGLAGAALGGGIGYYLGRHAGQATVRLSPLPPVTVPLPDLRKTLPPKTLPWPSLTPRPRARVAARIVEVTAGSPAERAGLRPGDLIVAVDDRPLTPAQDLARAISSHEPGDTVELTIEREGGRKNVSVTLGASNEDPSRPYLGVRYVMQFSLESGVPDLFERWRGRTGTRCLSTVGAERVLQRSVPAPEGGFAFLSPTLERRAATRRHSRGAARG